MAVLFVAGLYKRLVGSRNTALDGLALAVPQIKKDLPEACVQVVGADGVIQEREAELLHAIAQTLDCPIPPFRLIPESAIQTPQSNK